MSQIIVGAYTNPSRKAMLGLALVALHQLDLIWATTPDEIHIEKWEHGEPVTYVRIKVDYTITRHSDALMRALEAIVDSILGRGLQWE